ncbi:MAG: ATP-binding protein [bacterium]
MPTLKLEAVEKNLDKMIDFILSGVEKTNVPDKKNYLNKIRLAAEEALVNIINYAYGDQIGFVEIRYFFIEESKSFVIELIDEGIAFNPLEKKDPDISIPMEERQIGGLGVFMIKNIMDNVEYKREEGKNIFKMVKYFNNENSQEVSSN